MNDPITFNLINISIFVGDHPEWVDIFSIIRAKRRAKEKDGLLQESDLPAIFDENRDESLNPHSLTNRFLSDFASLPKHIEVCQAQPTKATDVPVAQG